MKILISGANGQLGQDLQKECQKRDVEAIATDFTLKNNFLNICDLKAVRDLITEKKPNAIINCAAYNDVDKAETEWEKAFIINGIGPKNLAVASNENRIPIIHFSTDYIFNGKKKEPYLISDEPEPLSKYGKSKLYGERMVSLLTSQFFIIRLSRVFGIGNTNFVKKVIDWSKEKEKIKIVEGQISSPSYTADLSKAILDLLNTRSFGIYHLTNSGFCSKFEWAEYILQNIGWKGELVLAESGEFNSAAERPEYSVLHNFPLKETIGYELPDWKDAVRRFLIEVKNA